MPSGQTNVLADASMGGTVFGHDAYTGNLHQANQANLIVPMCTNESNCKTAQSAIQFSGTVEDRADKNRNSKFEIVNAPRDHWLAYAAGKIIVLAMPITDFSPVQRDALEGFLRTGGRLILVESEIADASFLSVYRTGVAPSDGERVGQGTLFRVAGLDGNALGEVFTRSKLIGILQGPNAVWAPNQPSWVSRKFATQFDFPRLSWILIWLVAYIVTIGVLNFAVLRRLHRLELGWISICGLALLFAAGFYLSSANRRPRSILLDNLAVYYLDARSPLAAAEYNLRVSVPERRNVLVSVADPAVFTSSNFVGQESNSQIWVEMNRQRGQTTREDDIRLGPPRQVELSMLKWSFHDLDLQGLHAFPGTVHFIAPDRLRNDTGRRFGEAVYLDHTSNSLYVLPGLASGEEIQLDSLTPKPIYVKGEPPQTWVDPSKQNLEGLMVSGTFPFASVGRVFAGLSDGPALPVQLNVPHQASAHSLIVVAMERP